jgi:hypothetical protein
MSEVLNALIAANDAEPVKSLRGLSQPAPKSLTASIYPEIRSLNATLPLKKRISLDAIDEVLRREKKNGLNDFAIERAINAFTSTVLNPDTANPTSHVDLLPTNHPLSTEGISKFRAREITASYFESDTRIEDAAQRAMVASAIKAEPESAARKFFVAALTSTPNGLEYVGMVERADSVVERRKKF